MDNSRGIAWKKEGIEDSDLTVHNVEQTEEVKLSLISVYLDISLCNIKIEKWSESVAACDEALEIDPNHVKALYRKAIAVTTPAGSGLDDYKQAIHLLKKAIRLEPSNTVLRERLAEFQQFLDE